MPIIEPVIRPPSEAESFLLQITTGCSSNTCTFCGAYQGKAFCIKSDTEIKADIIRQAKRAPETRRVFLMDGDALVLDNTRLLPLLDFLRISFPALARIASYANGYNITTRSDRALSELYERRLTLIYMGLESGSQTVLDFCNKKSSVEEMISACNRTQHIGIRNSVIVLLGLGGRRYSREHVAGTIEALNRMQPRYVSFLSVMLIPGTPLYAACQRKEFEELNARELLGEMHDIVEGLCLEKTIVRSDHASNYLPIEGRLPHDKAEIVATIKTALDGKVKLRPEFYRGL